MLRQHLIDIDAGSQADSILTYMSQKTITSPGLQRTGISQIKSCPIEKVLDRSASGDAGVCALMLLILSSYIIVPHFPIVRASMLLFVGLRSRSGRHSQCVARQSTLCESLIQNASRCNSSAGSHTLATGVLHMRRWIATLDALQRLVVISAGSTLV